MSELLDRDFRLESFFRRAQGLYGNVIFAMLCGAAVDFTNVAPIDLLISTALFNGLIAPPFLAAMRWSPPAATP